MAAVQKYVVRVKHVFKPLKKSNETCLPCLYIRNKLCEATTQISWTRNVEERHGFWCRNGDQGFQNKKLQA